MSKHVVTMALLLEQCPCKLNGFVSWEGRKGKPSIIEARNFKGDIIYQKWLVQV